MNQKLIAILAVAVVVIAGVGIGVSMMDDEDTDGRGVTTDAAGRDFEIPDSLEKGIVTIGSSGPLRFLSIFDVYENIVEVDYGDVHDEYNGRAYSYAYDYSKCDTHPDVPKSSLTIETAEKIANRQPSLVITLNSVYEQFPSEMKFIDKSTNMLVLFDQTWNGFFTDDFRLSDNYRYNVSMIGKVLNKEARAEEHITGVQGIIDDIRDVVDNATADAKSFYIAGVTKGGSNPWNYTFPEYMPFDLTGAMNGYTGEKIGAKVQLDPDEAKEYIIDSDMMIIDPSSSDKILTEPSQDLMKLLYLSQKEGKDIRLFVTCPIVWDHINYDMVLACSYYLLHLQYGYEMSEVNTAIAHIFEVYYGDHGKNVMSGMNEFFENKCSKEMYKIELPIFSEIKIVENADGKYVTEAI